MSHVDTPYAQGTPCWVDLATPDLQASIDFYKDLFGWSAEPGPPETGGYALCTLAGRPVAGIMPAMAAEDRPAPPTVWTTYIAVDDADATRTKIDAAGGHLLSPAMDVMDLGRMFIATDPTGAAFGVWQSKEFFGAQTVNEPGALCWNELNTRDGAAAAEFYTSALGIAVEPMEDVPGYQGLHVGGKIVGGLQTMTDEMFPAEIPAHWMTYFAVDDTDSIVDAHVKAGGNVMAAPFDTPVGRIAVLADPQGGVFSVIELADTPS